MNRQRRPLRMAIFVVIALGLGLVPGAALADFPYPSSTRRGDEAYDYGAYMRTQSREDMYQLNDVGDKAWKYGSKTACELYGTPKPPPLPSPTLSPPPPPKAPGKEVNCSPVVERISQEQFGVTGSSVDEAWVTTTGRPDVVIAVHDSGIRWNDRGAMEDLANKTWLNHHELEIPNSSDRSADRRQYDVNNDGIFNLKDYCPNAPANCTGGDPDVIDLNNNSLIEPEDLIFRFSDGVDQDNNGYVDDFVGWDTYEDDNDPFDEVNYGHGTGEARDSGGEANNGGDLGSCPNCLVMHMRVGDSFIADVNDAAQGMIYATDNGASVLQSALGTLNNSRFAQEAINYAYRRGVALIASAADESAGHHNQPSVLEHAITFNSVGEPQVPGAQPPTYLEFRGCTNFGAYITAAVPSNSCSSEAVGRMSGVAGLMYSVARNAVKTGTIKDYGALDGLGGVPQGQALSAEEIDQLVSRTADDINFTTPLPYTDRTIPETQRYGATEGWDPFFGYGRVNARRMVAAIAAGAIPPEADITSPKWFEIVDPESGSVRSGQVRIEGFVASRRTPMYDYKVEWAPWSWREADRKNYRSPAYRTAGVTLQHPGNQSAPVSGLLATIDPAVIKTELAALNPGQGSSGPAVDPVTGRGENENRHLPDKFGVIVRVVATARNALGAPVLQQVTAPIDRANGGNDPRKDEPLPTVPLQGIGTKNFNFHTDPALFPGFPRDLAADGAAAPRFADLDDDGVDELVVATSNGEVHAYESGGGEVPGWPVKTTEAGMNMGAPAFSSGEITTPVHSAVIRAPAIGDLDRDGDLEVVVGDMQGRISVFDNRGRMLPGFPVRSDPAYSAPQRGDRENGFYACSREQIDSRAPNVVAAGSFPCRAANGFPLAVGQVLPNDPDLVPDIVNRHSKLNRVIWWFLAGPSLGDVDGKQDGHLEVVVGGSDRHLYVFKKDGSKLEGWPTLLRDPMTLGSVDPLTHEITNKEGVPQFDGAKIITNPALGDLHGDDGFLDIVSAVNEQYAEIPNTDDPAISAIQVLGRAGNQRLYALDRRGDQTPSTAGKASDNPSPNDQAFLPGWPAKIATAVLQLLPVVGSGPDGAPILADVDGDGKQLETGIFSTAGPGYILKPNARSLYGRDANGRDRTLLMDAVGPASNSPDSPSVPAVGGAIFSDITGTGRPYFAAPAAGLGKLLDVVLPDDQLNSDNHLAVWELAGQGQGDQGVGPRNQLPAFPREVNDLQFLTTPASANVDGDPLEEILEGTAYSDLHAFKLTGEEPGLRTLAPTGWPKFTAGWMAAPPGVGDWNGDGTRDVAAITREGFFFVWRAEGAGACSSASWPEWGHDGWSTNNFKFDAVRPRVITDLRVTNTTPSEVTLTWTAPGDDGPCGKAHSYDARRASTPVTTDNFRFAASETGEPPPGAPGTSQTMTVARACAADSHLAIQTLDADEATDTPARPANRSAASNSVLIPKAVCGGASPPPSVSPSSGSTPSSSPSPSASQSQSPSPSPSPSPSSTGAVPSSSPSSPAPPPSGTTPTALTIRGERTGQTTDATTLEAYLESPQGPVGGQTVIFTFQGEDYETTTDENGIARKTVTVSGSARSTSVEVRYEGSDRHGPSSDEESFEVQKEGSRLGLKASVLRPPNRGTHLKARLRDIDSPTNLAGRKVKFLVNAKRVGRAVTGRGGRAALTLDRRLRRSDKVTAVFKGDAAFLRSRARARGPRRS